MKSINWQRPISQIKGFKVDMKKLLFFTLLLSATSLFAEDHELFVKAGGAVGRYIGLKENYFETGLFYVPNTQENFKPILDASFYRLEDHEWASSVGLGFRWGDCNCDRAWGANVYYDARRFSHSNYIDCYRVHKGHDYLNRIGVGLESLGECLDFRINGYIPVGTNKFDRKKNSYNNIGGGNFASYREYEYNLYGIDGEVGYRYPLYCDFDLYAAVGGYYYTNKHTRDFGGPQGRLSLLYSDYVEFEGIYTYDRVNSSCFQGKVMLSIPLDALWNACDCQATCFNLFKQPIKRNGVIFTDRRCCWNYNW